MTYRNNRPKYGRPIPPTPKTTTEPKPLALPPLIRDAVLEVENNIKAPRDLVVASALGVVSLVCQNEIDVQWGDNKLVSPCSLFFLTIAASGDRKSTVDRHFTAPITAFEKARRSEYKEQVVTYTSEYDIWNEKRKDIRSQIKKASREGTGCEELEHKLIELDRKKPERPKLKKLIYTDATPESIVYGLYRDWPSAGILSDEAGSILNGRAMNDLGMLNQIWDGNSLSVDRRSSESFTLDGARLTISLMTQEKSLRKFIERNDGMARDIGFLARCLVSNPLSKQGDRMISTSSDEVTFTSEKLNKFNERLSCILHRSLKTESTPVQKKYTLKLSPGANEAWIAYFNTIENLLKSGEKLESVRDAASKIADNVVRMAAIFHYFQDRSEDISEESMSEAISTCENYIGNFLHIFGEYGLYSPEKREVDKLIEWFKLKIHGPEKLNYLKKNYARQNGPIRNSHLLDKALYYLYSEGAIDFSNENWTEYIEFMVGHKLFNPNRK